MAHYAKVVDSIVVDVVVADQQWIQNQDPSPGIWVQTSYNTQKGQHSQGSVPLRKNFAGIGYHYDPVADAFYPQRPFDTWILNLDTYTWEPPKPMPLDGKIYFWQPTINDWQEYVSEDTQ
jgi:hypothetical protein